MGAVPEAAPRYCNPRHGKLFRGNHSSPPSTRPQATRSQTVQWQNYKPPPTNQDIGKAEDRDGENFFFVRSHFDWRSGPRGGIMSERTGRRHSDSAHRLDQSSILASKPLLLGRSDLLKSGCGRPIALPASAEIRSRRQHHWYRSFHDRRPGHCPCR